MAICSTFRPSLTSGAWSFLRRVPVLAVEGPLMRMTSGGTTSGDVGIRSVPFISSAGPYAAPC